MTELFLREASLQESPYQDLLQDTFISKPSKFFTPKKNTNPKKNTSLEKLAKATFVGLTTSAVGYGGYCAYQSNILTKITNLPSLFDRVENLETGQWNHQILLGAFTLIGLYYALNNVYNNWHLYTPL